MAITTATGGARDRSQSVDLSWDGPDFERPEAVSRDWKKLLLIAGLGTLSWVATYVGMLELIEANMGELPLVHKLIIAFSVAMLMVMVVWLLDQMFSDIGWLARLLFGAGYIFLTIISVGFGFGFYWKVLESRSEASRSAEAAVSQVQTSLHAAMTRLEQLQGTLDSLTAISAQKAETERQSGTSCPSSRPGDGPRRKMRDEDAGRFKFAADFVKGRIATVRADIAALDGDLARIVKDDRSTVDARTGTRNEFMRNLGRKLDMTVAGFNAFRSDPQLKQIRIDLNERADKVTFLDSKGGTYACPDPQLTTALKGVVRAIDELPALEKPRIAAVEGSEAVIEAFRRLTATFAGLISFRLPPSPEELRELQKKAVQSVENAPAAQARLNAVAEQAGLAKRDYVPLAIALFVDLCLLLVSIRRGGDRLQGLLPKMRAAERGPVIQILARFNEIHRDQQIRENFEVFRHVVFDFHGDYYAAVPLGAPRRPRSRHGEAGPAAAPSDGEELQQEAHLLANLFASFERERIFTRVYSPLLSTRAVQKRLGRQGSKFAGCEAFRIYRFRSGAWSDIILGAVMGAARRVEAEKRRRRIEEEMFGAGPGLDLAGKRAAPHVPPATSRATPAQGPVAPPPEEACARSGSPAGIGGRHPPQADARAPTVTDDWRAPGPRPSAATPPLRGTPGPDADHAAAAARCRAESRRTGEALFSIYRPVAPWPRVQDTPDAASDRPPPAARPANGNPAPMERTAEHAASATASPVPGSVPENIVFHPAVSRPHPAPGQVSPPSAGIAPPCAAPQRDDPTVTVSASRETVTYTLPAADAALPRTVLESAVTRLAKTAPACASEAGALPPPLPMPVPDDAAGAVIALPEAAAEIIARNERQAWEEFHASGWSGEPETASPAVDDACGIAHRLRPERRDG